MVQAIVGHRRGLSAWWRPLAVCLALALAAATGWHTSRASGQDLSTAGSVQGSYLFVPTSPLARELTFDGFTTEAALKVSADISESVSGQVKMCFGCHGFELGMAFADFRVADEFNIRIGRFNPSFGDFALRSDPANHRTVDKPLAYDMGRMIRLREWNLGILPVPYIDHGVEINGTHWFDDVVQMDYAVYAVGGFRGPADAFDFDFVESRSPARYFVDNNSIPSVGGRLGLSFRLGDEATMSLAASGMFGYYDPDATLSYGIVGFDAYLRVGDFTLRAEYLLRRTEFFVGPDPEQRFAYGPGEDGEFDNFFLKDGWFVTGELRVFPGFEVIARFDGLRRIGNVPINDQLRSTSVVLRYTAGFNIVPDRTFRIKLFGEYYDFSDFVDEVAIQAGVAANF